MEVPIAIVASRDSASLPRRREINFMNEKLPLEIEKPVN